MKYKYIHFVYIYYKWASCCFYELYFLNVYYCENMNKKFLFKNMKKI